MLNFQKLNNNVVTDHPARASWILRSRRMVSSTTLHSNVWIEFSSMSI